MYSPKLSIVITLAFVGSRMVHALPMNQDCNAMNAKWQFMHRKLTEEGVRLLGSTTDARVYLSENASIMQGDQEIKDILDLLLKLGEETRSLYDNAPDFECTDFTEASPLYDDEEIVLTSLRSQVARKLLRGSMIGTIQESLPAGHIKDRQLKVDEFNTNHLKPVMRDVLAIARLMDMPQSKELYEYWETNESCDDIAVDGCAIIQTVATRLDDQTVLGSMPSICGTGTCR